MNPLALPREAYAVILIMAGAKKVVRTKDASAVPETYGDALVTDYADLHPDEAAAIDALLLAYIKRMYGSDDSVRAWFVGHIDLRDLPRRALFDGAVYMEEREPVTDFVYGVSAQPGLEESTVNEDVEESTVNEDVEESTADRPKRQQLLIVGNPVNGFRHVGPFDDPEAANEYGDNQQDDWWVADLEAPEGLDQDNAPEDRCMLGFGFAIGADTLTEHLNKLNAPERFIEDYNALLTTKFGGKIVALFWSVDDTYAGALLWRESIRELRIDLAPSLEKAMTNSWTPRDYSWLLEAALLCDVITSDQRPEWLLLPAVEIE